MNKEKGRVDLEVLVVVVVELMFRGHHLSL